MRTLAVTRTISVVRLLVVFGLVAIAVVLLRTAWVGDDAYITYRVVDNFVSGHGLTWNTDERVQVYTHPLWMLLMSPLYLVTGEPYFTGIVFSIVISLSAALLFATKIARTWPAALFGVTVFLFSKTFVDYSTSGLENPLTHLLLGWFLYVYLKEPATIPTYFRLWLIGALVLLTRMDLALLVCPALAYRFFGLPKGRAIGAALLGLAPFFAWEFFSVFYYGFPFPNTAYAKLNTGLPRAELLQQGMYYVLETLRRDPVTVVIVTLGLASPAIARDRRHVPIAIGILLYVLYVVWIGGGFMGGRFFTAPMFAAVVLLSQYRARTDIAWGSAIAVVIVIAAFTPPLPLFSGRGHTVQERVTYHGIVDERAWYFQDTGLFRANGRYGVDDHERAAMGRELREAGGKKTRFTGMVGIIGFYAGPTSRILDVYGLCDPLLARLPVLELDCRVGHCPRATPGYINTWLGRDNGIQDERLVEYYAKLHSITRDDLFEWGRIAEIWRMNTGSYEHLIAPFYEARRLQDRAERLFHDRQLEETIETAQRALELDPGRAAAAALMSRALRLQGNLESARRAAIYAITARGGKYFQDLYKVGVAYEERGDVNKSMAVYQEVLAADPNHFDTHVAVASIYERAGRTSDAIAHYEKALALQPDSPKVARRLAALRQPVSPR